MNILLGVFLALTQAAASQTASANLRNGWKFLEENRYTDAQREFEMAIRQNVRGASPRIGLALVFAYQGKGAEAGSTLKASEMLAKTKEDKLEYHASAIRLHTILHTAQGWLNECKRHFNDGMSISNKYGLLQYRMAKAYVAANELSSAQDLLAQVVAMNIDLSATADREWKRVQKVLRASPATRTGAGIAMQDRISRADLCALLASELSIEKLFKTDAPKKEVAEPTDIQQHRLRQDVLSVLQWGIRGLEVGTEGRFSPDAPVKRAEIAFVLEDILIKATGDRSTATRFIGTNTSPFSDVSATYAWFNSIMTVTSRGILEPQTNGKFSPDTPVEGADALLAVRKLASEVK